MVTFRLRLRREAREEDDEEDEEKAVEVAVLGRWMVGVMEVGAKMSERPPRIRRARVDVAANTETFVLAELDDGTEEGGG